jgi:RHS repeat-associated protein
LVAVKKGAELSYVLQDHLGSTAGTVNGSGAVVSTVKYFPYGSTMASTGTLPTDKKFTGQRQDNTGLYYYGARYYDPEIGRFINADTIVPNPADPQSLNRYSYCLNNPLRYIDPTGHESYSFKEDGNGYYDVYDSSGNKCGFTKDPANYSAYASKYLGLHGYNASFTYSQGGKTYTVGAQSLKGTQGLGIS